MPIEQICPPGLYFNFEKQYCNQKANVNCQNLNPIADVERDGVIVVFLPEDEDTIVEDPKTVIVIPTSESIPKSQEDSSEDIQIPDEVIVILLPDSPSVVEAVPDIDVDSFEEQGVNVIVIPKPESIPKSEEDSIEDIKIPDEVIVIPLPDSSSEVEAVSESDVDSFEEQAVTVAEPAHQSSEEGTDHVPDSDEVIVVQLPESEESVIPETEIESSEEAIGDPDEVIVVPLPEENSESDEAVFPEMEEESSEEVIEVNPETDKESSEENTDTDEESPEAVTETDEDSETEGEPSEEPEPETQFLENGCPIDPHVQWLLPHEKDCNLFYSCVWGEKELRQCNSLLHFNEVLQVSNIIA